MSGPESPFLRKTFSSVSEGYKDALLESTHPLLSLLKTRLEKTSGDRVHNAEGKTIADLIEAKGGQGHYQMLPSTIETLAKRLGYDASSVFSEDIEERFALEIMKDAGYDRCMAGTLSPKRFMKNLSKKWAVVPAHGDPELLKALKAEKAAQPPARKKRRGGSYLSDEEGLAGSSYAPGPIGAEEKTYLASHPLLEMIGQAEHRPGADGHNVMFGNRTLEDLKKLKGMNAFVKNIDAKNFTDLTINEMIEVQGHWHKWRKKNHVRGSTACGEYQFLRKTLIGLKKEMGLTGEERFSPEMQDGMAMHMLKRHCRYDDFLAGEISEKTFQGKVARIWASVPKNANGKSAYHGDGLNAARVDTDSVRTAFKDARLYEMNPYARQTDALAGSPAAGDRLNAASERLLSQFDTASDTTRVATAQPIVASVPVMSLR
ncbi:MAG: hypothetical protein K9G62_00660 [Alphaproteobacteria bacterium]|nr:hypothetical protein [Alphaproteobacteria bacterium]